ncbi:MAG: hypothetical protein JXR63_06275 [Spirochaetales bacterium]|nr:hypothetical protein [Spirochaetales bacterium]
MLASKFFYKKAKKLIFAENPDPNVIVELRDEFESSIKHLPKKMIAEIGDYFFDFRINEYSELIEQVEKMLPVIDLLNNEWEHNNDTMSDQQLIFIRELVNEFAGVLDMDFVTEIMQVMLKRKLI